VDDPTDLILVGADNRKISEQWAFEDMAAILSQLGAATLGGLNAQSIARFETRQAVPAGLVHAVRLGRPLRLKLGDLSPRGRDELLVRVGMPGQAPAAVDCLGEQYPRPLGERRVAGCFSDERRETGDDRELLGAIERAGVGEDLDPDVGGVAVDVGQAAGGQVVDEGRGVLPEHGMSGTCSIAISSDASFWARARGSANVPAAA